MRGAEPSANGRSGRTGPGKQGRLPFAVMVIALVALPACASQQEIEYTRARGRTGRL